MTMAMISAITASWIVTGSFSPISSSTGCWVRRDMPRSPWSALPAQARYCTGMGSFRRYFSRRAAMTSGSRSSPAITRIGSPGSRCCRENTKMEIRITVGIAMMTLRPRKASMAEPGDGLR